MTERFALISSAKVTLAGSESDFDRLKRQEREIRGRIGTFRAGDRLSRNDIHER
jgi:hypothetical protein